MNTQENPEIVEIPGRTLRKIMGNLYEKFQDKCWNKYEENYLV